MEKLHMTCSRCILDTSVPEIAFDENGVCAYCKLNEIFETTYPLNEIGEEKLAHLIERIKEKGKNKDNDCIIGVSGGIDSSFTLFKAKEFGLRPLAVHMDNGWNRDIAVRNILEVTNRLNVPLWTEVLDWEEFRDLQTSFIKASVPDIEVATDIAIHGALHKVAAKENINYIITGNSFRTQGTCPIGWTYMDGKYVRSVQRIFGTKKLKTYPSLTIIKLLYFVLIKKIKTVSILNYIDYRTEEAGRILENELGWKSYGGKHYESIFTRFFQSFILPTKFGIDKRKVHYSALIRSGQMTREEAVKKLEIPPISEKVLAQDKPYVLKKLGISESEFNQYMAEKPKSFLSYPTYYQTIRKLRYPIMIATKLNLLPVRFYEKYAKLDHSKLREEV